jgi:Transglycosylase SLT domain
VPLYRNSIAGLARAPRKLPSSFPAMFAVAARTSPRECTRRRQVSFGLGLAIVVALGCNTARAEPATARPVVIVAPRTPFAAFVAEASQRFGIPAAWIRAVMRAESFGDVRATSPKGAIGLMQIMPETWAALSQRYRLATILTTRTTTSSPAPPICASYTTAMAFPDSSRPTMPVPRAGKTISQPASRCLRRRAPICPVSHRSSAEVQPTTRSFSPPW